MHPSAAAVVEVANDLRADLSAHAAPVRIHDGGEPAIEVDEVAGAVQFDDAQPAQVATGLRQAMGVEDEWRKARAMDRDDLPGARHDSPLLDDGKLAGLEVVTLEAMGLEQARDLRLVLDG